MVRSVVLGAIGVLTALVGQGYAGYPSRGYESNERMFSINMENQGGSMMETEFLWIKAAANSEGTATIVLNSLEHLVAEIKMDLMNGNIQYVNVQMRKLNSFTNFLSSPTFACALGEKQRSSSPSGVQMKHNTLDGKPKVFDARIRVYERELYIHYGGRLLFSCIVPKSSRIVKMSDPKSKIQRIDADLGSVKATRISVEQTMYPFPYYEAFEHVGFHEGDIVHFNGFFRGPIQVMFVTKDDFQNSRYIEFTMLKDGRLVLQYVDPLEDRLRNYTRTERGKVYFRNFDWLDVFIERRGKTLLVSYGDEESSVSSWVGMIEDVIWNGQCDAVRILGSEGVLQYFRTSRNQDSAYVRKYMDRMFPKEHKREEL